MRRKSLIAVVVFSVAAVTAYADSGYRSYMHYDILERAAVEAAARNPETWREGAAGFEHADVAMAVEDVTITLYPDYAEVVAAFDFKNTASEAVAVEMCFPVSDGMLGTDPYEAREEGFTIHGRKADLAVTVDGAPRKYTLEEADAGFELTALACWEVDFAPGGTKRVVCVYKDQYGSGAMSATSDFDYVLYSGATWKGPIGKGVITVRPGEGFDWTVPLFYLGAGVPPARDDGDRIVWEFEDLEPSFKAETAGIPETSRVLSTYRQEGAGIRVEFSVPRVLAETYTLGGDYEAPAGVGAAAGVMVDGLNFRTAPDADAPRVTGKETLAQGEGIAILERRGEWYRARAAGGAEGWVRWRYVDPATGAESIYVELIIFMGE